MQMQNYYFTFGRHPEYPFGIDQYVMVRAESLLGAVNTFRQHHPNRPGSNLVNCADYYTEDAFNAFRNTYYPGVPPVEILYEGGGKWTSKKS